LEGRSAALRGFAPSFVAGAVGCAAPGATEAVVGVACFSAEAARRLSIAGFNITSRSAKAIMKVRKAEKNTNSGARRDCMGRSVEAGGGREGVEGRIDRPRVPALAGATRTPRKHFLWPPMQGSSCVEGGPPHAGAAAACDGATAATQRRRATA
jgi:hypothetical protein